MPLEYIVNGKVIEQDELLKGAPPAKKKVYDPKAEYHKGFCVEGFMPGYVAEAERLHKENLARWLAMGSAERADALKHGQRDPGPWSESDWLRKHRPKRISKLYGTPVAAETFAELAIKQGYTHVLVLAMAKGKL